MSTIFLFILKIAFIIASWELFKLLLLPKLKIKLTNFWNKLKPKT